MQASEMNLLQCRDFIANANGWTFETHHKYRTPFPVWTHATEPMRNEHHHPIGHDLDAAAAAMPEGWPEISIWKDGEGMPWCAKAKDDMGVFEIERADTELLARFRLAVACRQAQGAANGK
jgi:hypothetical protein